MGGGGEIMITMIEKGEGRNNNLNCNIYFANEHQNLFEYLIMLEIKDFIPPCNTK